MALIYIDISVFTPHSSIGVITGDMEVGTVPQVGEYVAFDRPKSSVAQISTPELLPGLSVEHVLAAPIGSRAEVIVMLADLTLPTREEATKAVAYLQDGFGLYFDDHSI